MSEFYIVANSFAAPHFSDASTKWVEAESAQEALSKFHTAYNHPFGLYAAMCYRDANAHSKGEPPLAKWLCNHEIAKLEVVKDLDSYSYVGERPGKFKVNDQWHRVEDPKGGRLV